MAAQKCSFFLEQRWEENRPGIEAGRQNCQTLGCIPLIHEIGKKKMRKQIFFSVKKSSTLVQSIGEYQGWGEKRKRPLCSY